MSWPRVMVAGYFALSLVLGLVGWLWGERMIGDVSFLAYIGLQTLLGPPAFALNLGVGVPAPDLTALWVFFYLVATALLALGVFLVRQQSLAFRILGAGVFLALWVACGWLNLAALIRGI